MLQNFLNKVWLGNSAADYLSSAGMFIAAIIIILIFKKIILSRLKKHALKTETRIDDFIIRNIERFIVPLLYVSAFYFAIESLKLHVTFRRYVENGFIIILAFYIIRFAALTINYIVRYFGQSREPQGQESASIKGISTFISIVVWAIGMIFLLDNLGVRISAVIAGLGIGGIAVALAAQAVLGDFFSYFVIFFDRPFQIGDFIVVDDKMGTVEKIGMKTTRVSSLSGEQIVFPNSNLTNSRIHNFKKMENRRVLFKLTIDYRTNAEQLSAIPGIIKATIEQNQDVRFDRAHFQTYSENGLVFEVVYYVLTPDYNRYMDIQQALNLTLFGEFANRGIRFAHPVRTLFVASEGEALKG